MVGTSCDRCNDRAASIEVRAQHMCSGCFMAYVTTKFVKQVEDFKVRYTKDAKPRRILLPLSLGASSVALLHLLDQQLARQQQRTTRTGFELLVVGIRDATSDSQATHLRQAFEQVEKRYPSHKYEFLPIHEFFRYHLDIEDILSPGLYGEPVQGVSGSNPRTSEEKLAAFLSSIPSASSRDDLLQILRLRLIVALAKENGCDCVVWGDSTTRLAEKTLSEAAKGRGFSLPWQTGDGLSPYDVEFKFPMRGLLRKEIVLFSKMTSPALTSLITDEPKPSTSSVSSKDLTIDALMGRYFASVEDNYPSIVTNVVRTTNRLQASESLGLSGPCKMCGLPFEAEDGARDDRTNQESDSVPDGALDGVSKTDYCYGCSISLPNVGIRH